MNVVPFGKEERYVKPQILDLSRYQQLRKDALNDVKKWAPGATKIIVTPQLLEADFDQNDFAWRLETVDGTDETFWFGIHGLAAIQKNVTALPEIEHTVAPVVACDTVDDDLGSDELRHAGEAALEAKKWVQGIPEDDIAGRARAVFEHVAALQYNSTGASLFYAIADTAIAAEGMVCDEYANVAIAHLRALNIPARLKYLLIDFDDDHQGGHACAEFKVGSRWVQMDPCGKSFDQSDIYRNGDNVVRVLVINPRFPDDRRSSSLTDALAPDDDDGDGYLAVYDDFCLDAPHEEDGFSRPSPRQGTASLRPHHPRTP
ncbi:MAG: transglutaminase-like domain-containing protein [Acidobacteriota bacterium]|nr:transglutaminase-like domain-containing protein [Acidobacteriota bacterium]